MDYHIYHLFPKLLNAYGDRGNILTLSFFAKEMGLNPIVHEIDDISQIDWDNLDFVLLGGGFENEIIFVLEKLQPIKDQLRERIIGGLPFLVTTTAYPIIGKTYEDSNHNLHEGLGLLNITVTYQEKTMIGNVLLNNSKFEEVIGFVNHNHVIEHNYETVGYNLLGYGNSRVSREEGLIYNNFIATFMSGPLLALNYNVTLFFLEAFAKKNGIDFHSLKFDLVFEKRTFKEMRKALENRIVR